MTQRKSTATSPAKRSAKRKRQRILGLDPGLRKVGYGFIESDGDKHLCLGYGTIKTSDEHPAGAARLAAIHDSLTSLIGEFKPETVSMEKLFFFRNVTSAIGVAQAQGILMLACQTAGLPISEYTPLQIKMNLTGYGRADKAQIQAMVQKLLGLDEPPKPADSADALAAALSLALQAPPAA